MLKPKKNCDPVAAVTNRGSLLNKWGDRVGTAEHGPAPPVVRHRLPQRFVTDRETRAVADGGFVTGIDIVSDGSRMVCNSDVSNGDTREAGDARWRHLLRRDTLILADYNPRPDNSKIVRAKVGDGTNNGAYCTSIAPSNPRIF